MELFERSKAEQYMEQYVALARQVAADGCVLLKNERDTLPFRKGDQIAVFGRAAFHY